MHKRNIDTRGIFWIIYPPYGGILRRRDEKMITIKDNEMEKYYNLKQGEQFLYAVENLQ